MEHRRDLRQKELEAHLDELMAELDVLEARARQSQTHLSREMLDNIEALKEQGRKTGESIRALEASTTDAFDELMEAANLAMGNIRAGLVRASERFREEE